ncbi:MAG: ABC transporter permease subunit [Christensenellales bacterium]|jgi:ABC-2 type transport system permease protein
MNLYLQEIRQNLRSLAIWSVCIVGLFAFSMAMFPTFSLNPKMLNDLMKSFPKELLDAFGMSSADFSKPLDYMAYMFQYILIAVGAQSILLGSSIVSREEADGTIEFLYAKPVTRTYIMTSKLLAGLTLMALLNAVFLGASLGVLNIVSTGVDTGTVALLCITMLLVQLMLFSAGLIVSMLPRRARRFTSVSLGILFATYFLGIMSSVSESLGGLRYVSPLKYFDPPQVVHTGALEPVYLVIVAVFVIGSVAGAYALYRRCDLSV